MTRLVVAPGGVITSAWGNQTHDQSTIAFTSTAQRDSDWPAPANGAQCYVAGVGWQRRRGGAWETVAADAATTRPVYTAALTRTSNAQGMVAVTAADMGMPAPIAGGVASVSWFTTVNTSGPQFAAARANAGALEVRIWSVSVNPAGTLALLANVSVLLDVFAW